MSLANLFPDEDYRFQMRFERGEAGSFFAPTAKHDALIAERRHWLRSAPETCAALFPKEISLLDEAIELARAWHGFDVGGSIGDWEKCLALGEFWEVDYLLLKCD